MKKFLLPILLFVGCVPAEQIRKTTETAALIDAAFTDHSRKWQELFMAGNPSQGLITAVSAAADDDRRRFHALMQAFIQSLNSFGAVDPVVFNEQLIFLAKEVKSLGGK